MFHFTFMIGLSWKQFQEPWFHEWLRLICSSYSANYSTRFRGDSPFDNRFCKSKQCLTFSITKTSKRTILLSWRGKTHSSKEILHWHLAFWQTYPLQLPQIIFPQGIPSIQWVECCENADCCIYHFSRFERGFPDHWHASPFCENLNEVLFQMPNAETQNQTNVQANVDNALLVGLLEFPRLI